MDSHPSQITLFAKEIALAAAQKIHNRLGNLPNSSFKPDHSVLTDLDDEIETLLRTSIAQKFPNHSIHGEEQQDSIGKSEYSWYLDPVDGTTNFTMSVPLFCTLIAVAKNDQVVTSVISFPSTNTTIWTEKNRACFNNNSSITPPTAQSLNDCTFLIDAGGKQLGWKLLSQNFSNILKIARSIRYLGSAGTSVLPLTGVQPFVYIVFNASSHDLIPISLIHRQAGRSVVNLAGLPWQIGDKDLISVQADQKDSLMPNLKHH